MESHKDPAHDASTSSTSRTILNNHKEKQWLSPPAMKKTTRGSVHRFRRRTGPERMRLPVLFHHRDCIRIRFGKRIG